MSLKGINKSFGLAAGISLAVPDPSIAAVGIDSLSFAAPLVIPLGLAAATAA